jgi:hypothetical protein
MDTKSKNISLKAILIAIGVGIWVLVLQNAGIIPKLVGAKNGIQTVYVTGGSIDADVSGSVSVDNTVDINISEINGHRSVFFNNPRRGDKDKYYVLPVTVE